VLNDSKPLVDKLEEFLRVLDVKIELEKMCLFESTATQKRRKNSDIDPIVVSKSFTGSNSLKRSKMILQEEVICRRAGSTNVYSRR
jgi:predicted nucleotidyltransferase